MVPQLLYRFIIGAIVLTLNAFPSRAYLSPLANDLVFVYASKPYAITNGAGNYATPAFVKLKWFPLANPRSETSAEVPNFEHSAFSPSCNYIALKGSGLSGKIYIFSFLDQSIVTLDLYEPTQEFLDDQQSITSGSLLWSPQGDRLAFTGVREVPASALDMQRADIYIFDLHQHKLTNATQDQSIVSNLVIPISWSPDGNWLL